MILILARNYTPADRQAVDLVVIHTMESPEKPGTAEGVAQWFAGPNAPQASAHYCIDSTTVVQTVHEKDVAWHAPGANHNGIGLEHAGFARQTPEEWADLYSDAMLHVSAGLCATICARWNIPVVWVDAEGLKAGLRGITSHAACTDAFSGGKGHWDPGPHFPIGHYLDMVRGGVNLYDEDLDTVRGVQCALTKLHFDPGPVDGVSGLRTLLAISHFQSVSKIGADGVVGPVTRAALAKALEELAAAPTLREGAR